jgi:SAM-dependent methyltransferase
MKMLNVGCGGAYHREWVNIDLVAHSPEVIAHDLSQGLPFAEAAFDVCYSSHVLEHLRKEEADFFLREQKRVLKPGGLLRVVVPDLEAICRNYLSSLDELVAGNRTREFAYDFSLLEMYDQTTRERSGGELLQLWTDPNLSRDQVGYIAERHGREAELAIEALRGRGNGTTAQPSLCDRFGRGRRRLAEITVRLLLGRGSVRALQEGLFRNSGEIHRVMYDRFSLHRLLASHGFAEIRRCRADESRIPDFNRYELDFQKGVARKPDSLFMEARKQSS